MCSTNSVTDEKEEIFSEGFYQKGKLLSCVLVFKEISHSEIMFVTIKVMQKWHVVPLFSMPTANCFVRACWRWQARGTEKGQKIAKVAKTVLVRHRVEFRLPFCLSFGLFCCFLVVGVRTKTFLFLWVYSRVKTWDIEMIQVTINTTSPLL
jgi:hypothetical protein